MAHLIRVIPEPPELIKKLNRLKRLKVPGVVRWNYRFEDDWSGDPSVFFWVILTDEASKEENLWNTTSAFRNTIRKQVDFLRDWGLLHYFSFRSESEQKQLKDEVFN